jgi:hypothetical protein
MQSAQFVTLVTVASCLWVSLGHIAHAEKPLYIAKQDNACQIKNLTAGELLSISDPPTKLTATYSISIGCRGNATGNLKLTFNPSVVYNGEATMQFLSTSGLLTGAASVATSNAITVPISSQGNQTGDGLIRVYIVAPPGKLLRAATNYKLVVDAAIIP